MSHRSIKVVLAVFRPNLVALALALCFASGCSFGDADNCSDDPVTDFVEFDFSPVVTTEGDYRLTLNSGPVSGSCEVSVGGPSVKPCTSARMSVGGLGESGQVELSSLRVWFDYAPPTLELVIERSTAAAFVQSYEPEYVATERNGAGCGLQRQATIVVALP